MQNVNTTVLLQRQQQTQVLLPLLASRGYFILISVDKKLEVFVFSNFCCPNIAIFMRQLCLSFFPIVFLASVALYCCFIRSNSYQCRFCYSQLDLTLMKHRLLSNLNIYHFLCLFSIE